jgi:SH3-like domain-containing protein
MRLRVAALALMIAAGGPAGPAFAQARDPNELPRYFSLRSDDVNLRTGPGVRYPVEWVFKRRNLPVEVVAEFETWRRIRDIEGTEGWVHQSMLSSRRTVLVTGEVRTLKARPDPDSPAIAMVEPGVVGTLNQCRAQWCNVDAGGYRGWLQRSDFWGVYPGENPR